MKTNLTAFVVSFVLFMLLSTIPAYGKEKSAGMSAMANIAQVAQQKPDNRIKILRLYLEKHDSPLANSSETFVHAADKYNLDWKLVAAISGLESGFGKQIPYNSYNAWGWGVYGNNVIYFASWDEGIETISKGIRERYMNQRGATNVYEIGSTYAASPTWASRVVMFMSQIEAFYTNYQTNSSATLSLTI